MYLSSVDRKTLENVYKRASEFTNLHRNKHLNVSSGSFFNFNKISERYEFCPGRVLPRNSICRHTRVDHGCEKESDCESDEGDESNSTKNERFFRKRSSSDGLTEEMRERIILKTRPSVMRRSIENLKKRCSIKSRCGIGRASNLKMLPENTSSRNSNASKSVQVDLQNLSHQENSKLKKQNMISYSEVVIGSIINNGTIEDKTLKMRKYAETAPVSQNLLCVKPADHLETMVMGGSDAMASPEKELIRPILKRNTKSFCAKKSWKIFQQKLPNLPKSPTSTSTKSHSPKTPRSTSYRYLKYRQSFMKESSENSSNNEMDMGKRNVKLLGVFNNDDWETFV